MFRKPITATSLHRMLLAASCVAGLGGGVPSARANDVVMFDRPPTVEELSRALGAGQPMKRTRSIVIDEGAPGDSPSAAVVQAPAPAPPPPAAPSTPKATPASVSGLARPSPSNASSPAKTETASVQAVGMPIQFERNVATVSAESEPYVGVVAELLRGNTAMRLLIEGHTDSSGSYAYNVQLSRSRAAAVRALLVEKYGVAPARLSIVGRGPNEPLDSSDPANPRNRRVQFRIRG